jgi:succinate dehydrogenase/fumarate reductase flavoprotein subunit
MSMQNTVSRREFIKGAAAAGMTIAAAGAVSIPSVQAAPIPEKWDKEADVIVAGAGAAGIPATAEAIERGASVILIDQNSDVGGYGIISWGGLGLGGGTRLQKAQGIADSPDQWFKELTDFKNADTKKNDRALVRALVDNGADTINWLLDHGVKLDLPLAPPSAIARSHSIVWDEEGTTRSPGILFPRANNITASGAGFIRPLEAFARSKGVPILLEHKLTGIVREKPLEGRVLGIEVENQGKKLYFKAKKGVVIATGGPKGNVQLRRVFDPRLTEEYQATGEPWAFHTGIGILAAQSVGAQLCSDKGVDTTWLIKRMPLGCRYAGEYQRAFLKGSPAFAAQRATGFAVSDYQNVILVKQSGLRFANEMAADMAFIDAAMADGGGPVWAIFDADAVTREKWTLTPPTVDPQCFFSADKPSDLAAKIKVPGDVLEATVKKYNTYVGTDKDADFGKPTPKYKIEKAPFYAAWATPMLHDSRAGLRINAKCQVLDLYGNAIPGLYAGGEAAGGISVLGQPRAVTQGRLAGRDAAQQSAV